MALKLVPSYISKFFWWINERHMIYLLREEDNEPWPWTDDEILRKFKFTNAFRQLDVGTVWLRENWLEPYADDPELFFNICLYRQINYWPTCEEIGYQQQWNPHKTEKIMRDRKARGEQVYTNAHMLTGTLGGDKINQTIWKILDPLWESIEAFEPVPGDTLEYAFKLLNGKAPGFGPFISYEVVTDLRHTNYLNTAEDIMTWANAGPGAMRGINRLYGLPVGKGHKVKMMKTEQYLATMRKLLSISPDYLEDHVPALEMREIEHSLCEFDKYERVRTGQGRPRVTFKPPHLR